MADDTPAAILYDDAGNPIAKAPGTSAVSAVAVQGVAGGVPLPLALPTGAATEATLATRAADATVSAGTAAVVAALGPKATEATLTTRATETTLASVLAALGPLATQTTLASVLAALADIRDTAGIKKITDAVNVVAASLPLPAGAATEATLATRASQATVAAILGQLDVALSTRASQATVASILAGLASLATEATLTTVLGRLDVALSTRASQATVASILGQLDVALSTRASQTTVAAAAASLASIDTKVDVSLSTRASEATLATRASEATLATRATEATLGLVKAKTDNLDAALSTRATEATLATRASEATLGSRASEVTLGTRVADATVTARLNTLGQKAMAASAPVVIASDQSPIPVTGTVTETNASIGVDGAAAPASSTKIGGPDGSGNLRSPSVIAAAPAGTEEALVTRNIPSGTQPVSATNLDVALSTRVADATVTARLNTLGQKAMAASAPVVIASDQSAVPVSAAALPLPTGAATEVTLAAVKAKTDNLDVALSTRATEATLATRASEATLATRAAAVTQTDGTQKSIARGGAKGATAAADLTSTAEGVDHQALDVQIYHGGVAKDPTQIRALTSADVVTAVGAAADGAAVSGNPVLIAGQDGTNAQSLLTDTAGRPNVVGAAALGASVVGNPVLMGASDANVNVGQLQVRTVPPAAGIQGLVVRQIISSTGTTSSVASSASSVTLLALNTSRIGAMIVNDSTKKLYVKCGTTASTTDYTKLLAAAEEWPIPCGYTGRVDGLWESANGNARLTEFT